MNIYIGGLYDFDALQHIEEIRVRATKLCYQGLTLWNGSAFEPLFNLVFPTPVAADLEFK